MTPQEYADFVSTLEKQIPILNALQSQVIYDLLGANSEMGELTGVIVKSLFNNHDSGKINSLEVIKELGDVFNRLFALMNALGLDYDNVISVNVKKLKTRYPFGIYSDEASQQRRDCEEK